MEVREIVTKKWRGPARLLQYANNRVPSELSPDQDNFSDFPLQYPS